MLSKFFSISLLTLVLAVSASASPADKRGAAVSTATDGEVFVTATAYTTVVETTTACGPSIKDCPASEKTHVSVRIKTVPATVVPLLTGDGGSAQNAGTKTAPVPSAGQTKSAEHAKTAEHTKVAEHTKSAQPSEPAKPSSAAPSSNAHSSVVASVTGTGSPVGPSQPGQSDYITSTIYTTVQSKSAQCADGSDNCASTEKTKTVMVTDTVVAFTTYCPITAQIPSAPSPTSLPAAPAASHVVTSTMSVPTTVTSVKTVKYTQGTDVKSSTYTTEQVSTIWVTVTETLPGSTGTSAVGTVGSVGTVGTIGTIGLVATVSTAPASQASNSLPSYRPTWIRTRSAAPAPTSECARTVTVTETQAPVTVTVIQKGWNGIPTGTGRRHHGTGAVAWFPTGTGTGAWFPTGTATGTGLASGSATGAGLAAGTEAGHLSLHWYGPTASFKTLKATTRSGESFVTETVTGAVYPTSV